MLSGGKWASDNVNSNGGKYSFNIPGSIAAGAYLLRGETIGLHVASNANGAQYYMYVDLPSIFVVVFGWFADRSVGPACNCRLLVAVDPTQVVSPSQARTRPPTRVSCLTSTTHHSPTTKSPARLLSKKSMNSISMRDVPRWLGYGVVFLDS